jgi:hypothetical protein
VQIIDENVPVNYMALPRKRVKKGMPPDKAIRSAEERNQQESRKLVKIQRSVAKIQE